MITGSSPVNHIEQDVLEGGTGSHKQGGVEETLSNKSNVKMIKIRPCPPPLFKNSGLHFQFGFCIPCQGPPSSG